MAVERDTDMGVRSMGNLVYPAGDGFTPRDVGRDGLVTPLPDTQLIPYYVDGF